MTIQMLQILFSTTSIVVNVALLAHGELERRRQLEAMNAKIDDLMRTSCGLIHEVNEARGEVLALVESPERIAATNGVRGYR